MTVQVLFYRLPNGEAGSIECHNEVELQDAIDEAQHREADYYVQHATLGDCPTQEHRKAFIKHKLMTDDAWLTRAVARIYANQTADEQASEATTLQNGVGFTGADAFQGTKLGEAATKAIGRGYNLSPKQCAWARKFMGKYAGQLERISRAA